MTTDLTGDSELSEEELDWDAFLPDPDDAKIAAEAAALEDRAELDLDDSDLDWEAALQEPEVLGGADGEARAGAAFDRIVDTVRRSVEDPAAGTDEDVDVVTHENAVTHENSVTHEPEKTEAAEATETTRPELGAEQNSETEREPEGEWLLDGEWLLETEPASEDEPTPPVVAFGPGPDSVASGRATEHDVVSPAGPDLNREAAWEQLPELEPHAVPTFEPEAAAATAVSAEPTWTTAPTGTTPEFSGEALPPASDSSAGDDREAAPNEGPSRARTRKNRERRPRSRIFTATVVLACLVLVLIAAAVAVRSLHHSASSTPSAGHPARTTSRVSPSPDAARIQTATDAVDSATTAAQVGLTSLTDFPTTSNVARVVYPYISSLQLYESFLAGSTVPAPARAAAASAAAQVRQELTFLDTIATLPPAQLGAYLNQFDADATRLQTTLSSLEKNLRTPAS
jgi:hypothetical protein